MNWQLADYEPWVEGHRSEVVMSVRSCGGLAVVEAQAVRACCIAAAAAAGVAVGEETGRGGIAAVVAGGAGVADIAEAGVED